LNRTCFAALLTVSLLPSAHAAAALIALDVGHSSAFPGAISARGRTEFGFNADLADELQAALTAAGQRSVLIGRDGTMERLSPRTRAARDRGATFLLSIHHDSAQAQLLSTWQWQGIEQRMVRDISGYSLFVSRKNPFASASLNCASAIGLALRHAGLHATPHHAARIPGEFKQWADREAGVYYFDNLVVLETAAMPAVLLEAGVILNPEDETELASPSQRRLIAHAVTEGLSACGAFAGSGLPSPLPGNIHDPVITPAEGR
jgi:N-acetylmuramoyl-L-alanine amidase